MRGRVAAGVLIGIVALAVAGGLAAFTILVLQGSRDGENAWIACVQSATHSGSNPNAVCTPPPGRTPPAQTGRTHP